MQTYLSDAAGTMFHRLTVYGCHGIEGLKFRDTQLPLPARLIVSSGPKTSVPESGDKEWCLFYDGVSVAGAHTGTIE